MMRKLVVVFLAVVFACSSVFAVTKPKKKEANPYKENLSMGFDIANESVDLRMWASDSFGIEAAAGLLVEDGFGLNLGFGVLFPVSEGDVSFYLAPGLGLGFSGSSTENNFSKVETSNILLGLGMMLKTEVFLKSISRNLSIGAGVGLGLNIDISNEKTTIKATNVVDTVSDTGVSFGLITGHVSPLVIRYYF